MPHAPVIRIRLNLQSWKLSNAILLSWYMKLSLSLSKESGKWFSEISECELSPRTMHM
jgi:hypothetical protein